MAQSADDPPLPPDPAGGVLRGIDRVVLRVSNVAAAVRYYRDVLGLAVRRETPQFATLAMPDHSEVLLHCDDDLPAEAVFLLVDDVRDIYRRRDELRLTFRGVPARVAVGYKGVVRDPFGTPLLLIDRTLEGKTEPKPAAPGAAPADDRSTPWALFPGMSHRREILSGALIPLYEQAGRTADDLPYTPQFEQIHAGYVAALGEPIPSRAETWRHLLSLRKKGVLPRLGAAKPAGPVDDTTVTSVRRLIDEHFDGRIGTRDRLPYSEAFEHLLDMLNSERKSSGDPPVPPHQLWRIVASLAK